MRLSPPLYSHFHIQGFYPRMTNFPHLASKEIHSLENASDPHLRLSNGCSFHLPVVALPPQKIPLTDPRTWLQSHVREARPPGHYLYTIRFLFGEMPLFSPCQVLARGVFPLVDEDPVMTPRY